MSAERAQDDIEAQQNDASVRDAPDGLASDNDYTSRVGQKQAPIPVQSDADAVADNNPDVDDPDSDKALEQDEAAAIDKSNIMDSRTRGGRTAGNMREPSDEELGIPGPDDGTSRLATEGVQDPTVKDI
ncbi:hypothetical protein KC345_g3933 [Hortaea werneckii]|nr:hypothetical protein KC345_g3933 [Hortaea werneckii]